MERVRAAMAALTLDLFACAAATPSRFIAYSRDRNAYRASRYRNAAITFTAATDVVDFLECNGWAEGAGAIRAGARPDVSLAAGPVCAPPQSWSSISRRQG